MNLSSVSIFLILSFHLLFCLKASAQINPDLLNVNYSYVGEGEAENKTPVSFYKYHLSFMIPQQLKGNPLIIFHRFKAEKLRIHYGININTPNELKHFSTLTYSFDLTRPLENGWRITGLVEPGISSNLESHIEFKDLRLLGIGFLTKTLDPKKNKTLSLGLMYTTTLGIPAPLPYINYQWEPSKKWIYNVGFPNISVTHLPTEKTKVGGHMVILGENLTLTKDLEVTLPDDSTIKSTVNNIKLSNIAMGIFLNQKMGKFLKLKLDTGYTFRRVFEFANHNESIISFNLKNSAFIQVGFGIGL